MDVLLAIVVCLLAFLILWRLSGTRKKPPGPWGLPILGYLPFLGKKPYLELQRLATLYGNVFSIHLGSHYIVVLNDFETCKEAFNRDVFIGRPLEFSFETNEVTKKTGAIFGPPWKEQRKFTLHALRNLGFGKSKMEAHMQEEITEVLENFEKNTDQPFCIREIIAPTMSNTIGALVFGRRFKSGDPIRKMLNTSLSERARAAGQVTWTLHFPCLKKLLKILRIRDVDRASKSNEKLVNFVMQEIEEHEKSLDPENIRDYIDAYLLEMRKREGEPAFNKFVLQDLVLGFYCAGSETVRLTIEWLIIAMGHDQDGQRRIQTEIDEIVGQDRVPIYSDQKKMPYTYAFIMEMQRWKTLIPLNLMRYTLADTELNGYFIEKHTQILANFWAIHHDKHYWGEDADEFRPERFLSEDGKSVKNWDHHIPFSIGKRACPGEPLAKTEVFLYFTAIMQKFSIRFPDGKTANFDADLGIGLIPKAQEIIMTKRTKHRANRITHA